MKFKNINFFSGLVAVSALGLLSACATTPAPAPVQAAPVAAEIAPDNSQPTSPIGAFVVEAPKPSLAEPVAIPERGSVASVVKKMETSPYTLYWKESDSYSYYVGGLFDAEYKAGSGLTVLEAVGDDTGITCKFDANGKLGGSGDEKSNKACSALMFTLDDELSD